MKKRKELVEKGETEIKIKPLFSEKEVLERDIDYLKVSDRKFDADYKDYAFKPISIFINDKNFKIQYNFCVDTFCPNYGEEIKLLKKRGTRSVRNYTFMGSKRTSPFIQCNIMEYVKSKVRIPYNNSILVSNWSIAEEIRRLSRLSMIKEKKHKYQFHKNTCLLKSIPFDDSNNFSKYGKTKSGSQRYKCKSCGKFTNVNEDITKNFSYNQKRNDILLDFIQDIMSRTPVRKVCEKNNISPKTYYKKIEWIYRKCLEFLNRYEKGLTDLEFHKLYLNIDAMSYSINNIRKKGKGGHKKSEYEKRSAQDNMTSIIAIGDTLSNYIFSADLSYDSEISLSDIASDTTKFHFDHSYNYLNKNDRIRNYSFEPQIPTSKDKQILDEYHDRLAYFNARKNFVEGLHVNKSYTLMARLFLLHDILNYNKLIVISDDESSIQQSVFRVFKDDFKDYKALYFTSQYDKTLTRENAFTEAQRTRNALRSWGKTNGYSLRSIYNLGIKHLEHVLTHHSFYKDKNINGVTIKESAGNLIEHPLPAKDEGKRFINLISYNPHITNTELANTIIDVNMRTIDNFFQEIRRKVNILERPLVGARGAGKTYIYANYNPKYAHMILTIFRTLYNFVWERNYYDKKKMTPAQRIGLTDKKFNYRDIIYFR